VLGLPTVQVEAELQAIVEGAFPGASIATCEPLSGGVSARAVVVELRTAQERTERVVVRRPTRDTADEARKVVATEQALLSRLPAWNVPAPRLRHADLERGALVLDHVDGTTDLAPPHRRERFTQMADVLTRIHRAPIDAELSRLMRPVEWGNLPPTTRELDTSLDEAGVRAAIARFGPPERPNAPTLLHGDYWPGNLLWRTDELVAVLDWESAKVGDPVRDLAITRLDVLWVFGEQAMNEITDLYRARREVDFHDLARWDLQVALRPMGQLARWAPAYSPPPLCRPDIDEPFMREGHRRFVRQAIEALSSTRSSRP
jgi:aminoglycoside phosphotransferase (APT) family kinase protein